MPEWRRTARAAWPLLQGTAAATIAWIIAKHVALHPQPFFAPIAAVIGLNAPFGERGSHTLRLLLGVFVGIIVAELTLLVLGGGYGRLALATFVAMVVARALGGARIVIGQAAASAILTLATADGEYGLNRIGDALIGATIALGFSQVLFSPEPVGLVRRAEENALAAIAEGFARTARALESDDPALVERALDYMRDVRDRLADLARSRRQSPRVARHSAVWWGRRAPLLAEDERAGHLDLLGTSCLMLTRTALVTLPPDRARLAATLRELGRVFADLAKNPGDRATRQAAADQAVLVTHRFEHDDAPPGSGFAAAAVSLRLVAADVLLFAGVAPDQIVPASHEGAPA
jgi:uncharacterized membrane protein YgaE (UPF0421/DUF939 family)